MVFVFLRLACSEDTAAVRERTLERHFLKLPLLLLKSLTLFLPTPALPITAPPLPQPPPLAVTALGCHLLGAGTMREGGWARDAETVPPR